ncbi:MAG: MFS transporter [Leptospirales bacterium]
MKKDSESGSRHPLAREFGMTSLFADFSYEMSHVLLPFWLIHLGGSALILALLEGLSELARISGGLIVRKGDRSDRALGMKVRTGYALSMVATPLMAAASLPWHLIVLKSISWFGKGLRGPARDTLLAEKIVASQLPSAFSKIRALDQTGGILGPMVAVLLWGVVPVRELLWGTALPGIACLIFARRAANMAAATPTEKPDSGSIEVHFPRMIPRFRLFLLGSFLIRMGLFPATLLMFQFGASTGLPRMMGMGFVLASLSHVSVAVWLSRRTAPLPPWRLTFLGSAVLTLALLVMGFDGRAMVPYFVAMSLWGVADVLLSVGPKSIIPRLVSHENRLGAFASWEISGAAGMIIFQPAISLLWDRGDYLAGFLGATLAVLLGTTAFIAVHRSSSYPARESL